MGFWYFLHVGYSVVWFCSHIAFIVNFRFVSGVFMGFGT